MKFISDEEADWWNNSGVDENLRPVLEGTGLHDMLCVDRRTGKYSIYDPETGKATPVSNVRGYKDYLSKYIREESESDGLDMNIINGILKKY